MTKNHYYYYYPNKVKDDEEKWEKEERKLVTITAYSTRLYNNESIQYTKIKNCMVDSCKQRRILTN